MRWMESNGYGLILYKGDVCVRYQNEDPVVRRDTIEWRMNSGRVLML
jgi:pyruvate/oxaloacetate carboxyltransferase